jgi:transglutaminase-like putative cysteine protease
MPGFPSIRFALTYLVLLSATAARADDAGSAERRSESWQAIAIQGQRVGYGHVVSRTIERDGTPVVVSDARVHTSMKRFDGKLTLIVDQHVEERPDGSLLRLRMRVDNPPASRIETVGDVQGDTLTLKTTSAGQTTTTRQTVPEGVKSPLFPDRIVEEMTPGAGESRELQLYDPQLGIVVKMLIAGHGREEFELPDGSMRAGPHVSMKYLSGIPGLTLDVYLNEAGETVLNRSPLLGTTVWTVSREEALKEIPQEIDLGLAALIKTEPPLEKAHQTQRVRYRIHSPGGLDVSAFATGATQSATQADERTVDVVVTSIRPGEATGAASRAAAAEERYLAATSYANSEDAEIIALANQAGPMDSNPAEIATAAESVVHGWLKQKNMSSNLATASEVVRSREGDCSEHAVLLAAVLRARGIPARAAVGLVYWERYESFAGHIWTEAWLNGHWVPLDATLAQMGVGAAHIKLADSSLADGDAGVLLGAIAAWRLLDQAEISVAEVSLLDE